MRPCFEFESPGVWPTCVIKMTLKLDCFSAKTWASMHEIRTSPLFTFKIVQKNTRSSFKVIQLMLQTRISNIVLVARQSNQRYIFAMGVKWILHRLWQVTPMVRQKHLRKVLLPVLLSISDYKRLHTSLYFIVTNFHTEPWHEFSSIYNTIHTRKGGVEGGPGPSLHFETWHFLSNF